MTSTDEFRPKYQEVFASLRDKIVSGEYAQGQRLPSESALCGRFGVSRPTAARALRELAELGLIERRAGSGSFVLDRPAPVSQRQLGLLIPGLETTEIFETICGQLASLARAEDYTLIWGSTRSASPGQDSSPAHAEQICRQFVERKVSGVFFAPFELSPSKREWNHRIAEQLRQAGIPVVLIDRDLEDFPRRSGHDLVSLDNVAAGFLAAEHLLKLGCRKIAFFSQPLSAPTVDARMAGAREAFVRNEKAASSDWIIKGDPSDQRLIKSLVASGKWEAFICANDRTAAQLQRTIINLGFKVPQDARLVGFDDVKYATLIAVPLTTVHQPCEEIAWLAFNAMLQRVAKPAFPVCCFQATPRLVVRESCGTYLPR